MISLREKSHKVYLIEISFGKREREREKKQDEEER